MVRRTYPTTVFDGQKEVSCKDQAAVRKVKKLAESRKRSCCLLCHSGRCVECGMPAAELLSHYRDVLLDERTHAVFTTKKKYHSLQLRGKKKNEWKKIVSQRLRYPAKGILQCSLGRKTYGSVKLAGNVNGIVTISEAVKMAPGKWRPFDKYDVKYPFHDDVVRFRYPFKWSGNLGVNPVPADRVSEMAIGLLKNSPVKYAGGKKRAKPAAKYGK